MRLAPGADEFLQDLGYEEPTVSSAYQRLVRLQSQENHEEFQERMVSKLLSQLLSREERSRRQSERRTRIFELHPRSGIRQGDSLSPLLFDVITAFLIYDIKSLHVDVQILLYVTQIEATATGASDCRPSGGTVFRFTCPGRGGGGIDGQGCPLVGLSVWWCARNWFQVLFVVYWPVCRQMALFIWMTFSLLPNNLR